MHPTILIGLDGATFSVLDSLIAAGHLPCLEAFMAGGVRAELLSTPHPLTPPAWTTLMTGRSPANHGIFDFLRTEVRKGGAFFTLNNFRDIRCETIWTMVSRAGGRVVSLGYPLMAPPPAVSGWIIPGLLSWRHLRRNVYPPEFYDELKALPGFSARELSWDFEREKAIRDMPEEEFAPWVRFHTVRERHWFNILRHLLGKGPCDLTAVMFDGVDKLQHGCWRFLDEKFAPADPSAWERQTWDACLEYFRQLDGFIGQVVRMAGPQARVFIASDHGFGPTTHVFRVNKWLERQGYLTWRTGRPAPAGRGGGEGKSGVTPYVPLDWERTVAFAPSMATNGIHIRVKRNPDDPGVTPEEYGPFRARLMAQLREVRDPATGAPFVTGILTREEAFPGAYQENAPDLTLVLMDYGLISVLDEEPIIAPRPKVGGTHRPEGILLASGPGVRKGQVVARQSILDTAPTLLYSLGLPIPSDFEGRVIEALFEPAHLKAHPVEEGPPTQPPQTYVSRPAGPQLEDGAEETILRRLRALGYVE